MENQETPNVLLKNKYDLHKSPEVEGAANRQLARTGEKIPQNPLARIQNYLDRFREIIERPDPTERDKGIVAIKQVLLPKFVTKTEDIPESYWKSQERILRERGQQGDYNRFSEEEKNKWKKELSEGLLDDQRSSLEQWIDYLASSDSSYMPDYMKYWVFRCVTGLQEYDKEQCEFPKRSKGTVKMFPDINHEALSYVIDAVMKKYKGEPFSFENFEYDLTEEAKQKFKQNLNLENFARLYAWANELIQPIPQHLLVVTEGQWVKYDQDNHKTQNYKQLNQSIQGRGTGWCTAGENTAKTQLQGGDFYVFYSNDQNNHPKIPRIAIRIEGGKIAEVRGIAYKQNLDPYMSGVLTTKLEEFPDKDQFLKKEADMRLLTEIDNKTKAGQLLDRAELTFLYEVNSTIEGFGYEKDPRIAEVRSQRDVFEDMSVVFGCSKQQIARRVSEIRTDSKVYIGPLEKNIFKKLRNIEYMFSDLPGYFPKSGEVIKRQTIEIGDKSRQQLEAELKEGGILVDEVAGSIIESPGFFTLIQSRNLDLIVLKAGVLCKWGSFKIGKLYASALEYGLELCPPEIGPQILLKDKNLASEEKYFIAMDPIFVGSHRIFCLDSSGGRLSLKGTGEVVLSGLSYDPPESEWLRSEDKFVFALRPSPTLKRSLYKKNLNLWDRIIRRK